MQVIVYCFRSFYMITFHYISLCNNISLRVFDCFVSLYIYIHHYNKVLYAGTCTCKIPGCRLWLFDRDLVKEMSEEMKTARSLQNLLVKATSRKRGVGSEWFRGMGFSTWIFGRTFGGFLKWGDPQTIRFHRIFPL